MKSSFIMTVTLEETHCRCFDNFCQLSTTFMEEKKIGVDNEYYFEKIKGHYLLQEWTNKK